jgi:diguanylate cyclase (GGDEF)-like protein
VIGAVESFVERPSVSARHLPDPGLTIGHGLDAITQLPERSYVESHLLKKLKFASEHIIPFGLLCIQLDGMQALIATNGLDAAEAIANVVAHTLRNGLEAQDFVGCWSEDRFLAIIKNWNDGALLAIAERLKRLAQSSEVIWWGDQLSVTVSVGGTVSCPGELLESLLGRAQEALQQAVAEGGSHAVVLLPSGTK